MRVRGSTWLSLIQENGTLWDPCLLMRKRRLFTGPRGGKGMPGLERFMCESLSGSQGRHGDMLDGIS